MKQISPPPSSPPPPSFFFCLVHGIGSDYASFDEIPEANVCDVATPEQCEIINPIEFAKHGESEDELESGFFQKAKELLGMAKA